MIEIDIAWLGEDVGFEIISFGVVIEKIWAYEEQGPICKKITYKQPPRGKTKSAFWKNTLPHKENVFSVEEETEYASWLGHLETYYELKKKRNVFLEQEITFREKDAST